MKLQKYEEFALKSGHPNKERGVLLYFVQGYVRIVLKSIRRGKVNAEIILGEYIYGNIQVSQAS